jgi:hypothetical protein
MLPSVSSNPEVPHGYYEEGREVLKVMTVRGVLIIADPSAGSTGVPISLLSYI